MKNKHEDENPFVDNDNKTSNPNMINDLESEAALPDPENSEVTPEAKLEAELSEARDKFLRLSAEFENYKKRIARDRIEQTKMAGTELYISILPVIDDFERAMQSINESSEVNAVREGIQLIYTKMKSIVESRGLKPMNAVGLPFDPELHDAISSVDVENKEQSGFVIQEIERGYMLYDRVIRHAKVIVGK